MNHLLDIRISYRNIFQSGALFDTRTQSITPLTIVQLDMDSETRYNRLHTLDLSGCKEIRDKWLHVMKLTCLQRWVLKVVTRLLMMIQHLMMLTSLQAIGFWRLRILYHITEFDEISISSSTTVLYRCYKMDWICGYISILRMHNPQPILTDCWTPCGGIARLQ